MIWNTFNFQGPNLKNLKCSKGNDSLTMKVKENNWWMPHNCQDHECHPAYTDRESEIRDKFNDEMNYCMCRKTVTSVFAVCLLKESQSFDELLHPYRKIRCFWQVNSFLIFQVTIVTLEIGLIRDMLTFHLEKSIKIRHQEWCMKCVKWNLLKSKVLRDWF